MPNAVHQDNFSLLGYTDQGDRADGVQVMVNRSHAYVAHLFSSGFSVVDVSDPRSPRPVGHHPTSPGTWSLHLQTSEDLLLLAEGADQFTNSDGSTPFSAGMRVYDISSPAEPLEIGFMSIEGVGIHRIWFDGGRYAYASAHLDGFTDFVFLVIDVSDPAKPEPVGQWWIPGMWTAGGETPTWSDDKQFACHHGVVADGTAYVAWRDGGFTMLDVTDPHAPTLMSHLNWDPPFGGGTHSALPLPDRDLAAVGDEGHTDTVTFLVDVREVANPVTISTLPSPSEEDYDAKPGDFSFHNFHENRSGAFQSSDLIFATYNNAGVRAYDISDRYRPQQVGCFVPPPPERSYNPASAEPSPLQTCDIFVDENAVAYITDWNGGLHILQYEG